MRTSINRRIWYAFKMPTNSSIGRVECPIVPMANRAGDSLVKLFLLGYGLFGQVAQDGQLVRLIVGCFNHHEDPG